MGFSWNPFLNYDHVETIVYWFYTRYNFVIVLDGGHAGDIASTKVVAMRNVDTLLSQLFLKVSFDVAATAAAIATTAKCLDSVCATDVTE